MDNGSKKHDPQSAWFSGITDSEKATDNTGYAFGRSVDVRSDPRSAKLLPRTSKESGSTIIDLPKWGDRINNITYIYGDTGTIYSRTLAGVYTNLRTVPDSHGNGLRYYGEDEFLYYTSDIALGRYGPSGSDTPNFVDDFLTSEGGVPLNTHAIDLELSSSQYLSRADTASLSITGDLALEAYIKPESLPAVGESAVLVSKWDESGTLRSYRWELYAISGYFGDGSDGALTVSSNTTQAPLDANATGTTGTNTLAFSNASATFASTSGKPVLIHQTQGTGAGTWQRNTIVGVSGTTSGTLTLETALNATYTTGTQIIVLPQYSAVTVNSGITWTAKAWNGTKGGILAFLCSGTATITGTISANGGNGSVITDIANNNTGGGTGGGFRGGNARYTTSTSDTGYQGEGTAGAGGTQSTSANGNGGGGSAYTSSGNPAPGGSGGNGTAGSTGSGAPGSTSGSAGSTAGSADLTTLVFGGGGGGAAGDSSLLTSIGAGASGGGIIFITATTLTVTGSITSNGGVGGSGHVQADGASGAGGSVLLKVQTATLGTALITASGGVGAGDYGPNGGTGRVHIDYYTSYSGTTTPTLNFAQDNTLVTTTSYQQRLGISSTGLNSEYLTKTLSTLSLDMWTRLAVSWDASTSTATFFVDGLIIGTSTGALTAIHDNASDFHVGAYENSGGTKTGFFDGKIDDVRVWNTERTQSQVSSNKDIEVPVNAGGLVAYYQFDNSADDSTSNANHLTASGSPVYTTDVPFSSPTTRLDLDQSLDTSGQVYAVPTSISETAANRQSFVPAKDPQKSIQVNVSDAGDTADWTLTVHDAVNRTVASATLTNANVVVGDVEFIFDDVWRPVLGATYHFHLTVTNTTGTPAVVTTTVSDLETADFHTYYQFLVTDTQFHPMERIINLLAIGNERYVATWNGSVFNPHRLTLPAGYKVRCFAHFQGFLAIGCTIGDNVYSYDEGKIFFWDGISTTYHDFIDVPEGAINAMKGSQGTLYIMAGYQGTLLEYTGGRKAKKVEQVPKIGIDEYIEIMPSALNMYKTLLRIGVGVTDSENVEQGVYTYGALKEGYPDSLTYDYPISTGNRVNSNIKIGLVLPIEKKLLIGWKDNTGYGIDIVDPAGSPFATGTIEFNLKDYGAVWKEKSVMMLRADFEALRNGESVKLKYRLDRDDEWIEGSTVTTTGARMARLPIGKGRHNEMQFAVDLATSTTTSPKLVEVTPEEDVLANERNF